MSVLYVDGDFTVATAVSKPRYSQPFQGDSGFYVLQQDFQQFVDNFAPLALNTPHPVYATFFLTNESAHQTMDGGVIRWTRTYCQVPSSRNDVSSINYRFIGYAFQTTSVGSVISTLVGRPRVTRTVAARVQHDYYLVGTGGTYTNPSGIPILLEQAYYTPLGNTVTTTGGGTTFTPFYLAGNPLQALTGNAVDFLNDNTSWLGVAYSDTQTVPSRTDYLALVTSGAEIIAEGSKLSRWQGNIIDRTTVYIKAQ